MKNGLHMKIRTIEWRTGSFGPGTGRLLVRFVRPNFKGYWIGFRLIWDHSPVYSREAFEKLYLEWRAQNEG